VSRAAPMDRVRERLSDRYPRSVWIQSVAESPIIEKVYISTEAGLPLFRRHD